MSFSRTGVLSLLVMLCALPLQVFAHATPVEYAPAAGETVLEAPASISVRFTERIEMGASSLTVFGPDGNEVQEGKGTLSSEDPRLFSVPLSGTSEGVYTVSWQVVSVDDGHFTKGAYSFLVDATGKAFEGDAGGTTEVVYSSQLNEALLSFLVLIGESILLIAFAVLVARRKFLSDVALGGMSRLMPHFLAIGAILFIAGSAIAFFKKSLELASLQGVGPVEGMLIYSTATAGSFMVLKIVAALVFVGLFQFIWSNTRLQRTSFLIALFIPLLAILFMQSQVSHAAASHVLPKLSVLVTLVHLAAKELIVGGLVLLAVVVYAYGKNKMTDKTESLLRYFNLLAGICLIGAAASGAYVTWLHLKHLDNLFLTQWGERFIYLIGATLILGVFRLFHQFILTPYFRDNAMLRKASYMTVPAEAAVALVVLFFSGYISLTTPPYLVASYDFAQEVVREGAKITMEVHPYEHEMMRINVTDAATGSPVDIDGMTVTAVQTQRNIGPNVLPLSQRATGSYVFPLIDLLPGGEWDIDVIVDQEHGYDAFGQFSLSYPDDIEASLSSDETRNLDTFALWSIVVGIGASAGGAVLAFLAYRSIRRGSSGDMSDSIVPSAPLVLFALISVAVATALSIGPAYLLTSTQLKQECLSDGYVWQQTYPTREFEPTSPNAQAGCTVHDGHYHFIDLGEYHYFKMQ